MVWTAALGLRLLDDDEAEVERQRDTLKAILKAPPYVIADYGSRYFRATYAAVLACTAYTPGDDAAAEEALEQGLRAALRAVAKLAADFAGNEPGKYGANIMLAARPTPGAHGKDLFPEDLRATLRFIDPDSLDSLQAVLYMPPELRISTAEDGVEERDVPVISLPVPRTAEAGQYKRYLPGAPAAFLTPYFSVQGDTLTMGEDCKHLTPYVRGQVDAYFSPGGEGASIRSFASFRLSDLGEQPVGVLNIDASVTKLLGYDELLPSFASLLEPLLFLLRGPVSQYAELRARKRELYGQLTRTAEMAGSGADPSLAHETPVPAPPAVPPANPPAEGGKGLGSPP